jgi:drug/metabolite transporter (DMT)-like permease
MLDWYILSIIALILFGFQNFLYKVAAEKRCNTAWILLSFMGTVAVLSSILFFVRGESIAGIWPLILVAIINGAVFMLLTTTRIESLRHIDASIAFPIIRTNSVLVVLMSLIIYGDRLSGYQVLGILLGMSVIGILARDDGQQRTRKNVKLGLVLALISMVVTAFSHLIMKYAAVNFNLLAFIAISYAFNTFLVLGLRNRLKAERKIMQHQGALLIGILIGLFNFFAFYLTMSALSVGPLSIISTIVNMYFVTVIVLSIVIYKEKVSMRRLIGFALTVAAVILLGL